MLEIVILFFLTKGIGKLAIQKGLPAGRWKFITVMAWIGFEMTGILIGLMFFGKDNLYGILGFAIFCAFGGYLSIRFILENKPDDKMNEEVNRIGVDELSP
jgi:hypothetical protein